MADAPGASGSAGRWWKRWALVEALGAALEVVTAEDARGSFKHCGYRTPAHLYGKRVRITGSLRGARLFSHSYRRSVSGSAMEFRSGADDSLLATAQSRIARISSQISIRASER